MRKISKIANKLAKSIVNRTEMADSVAILALAKEFNEVPVAGYAIKVGPSSKALGFSEEDGGKITATVNSQTCKEVGYDNDLLAFADALESLKAPSKVFLFTDDVNVYDALVRLNPNEGEKIRWVTTGTSQTSTLTYRLHKLMKRHNVVVRTTTYAQREWISELVSQMMDTANRHIVEEFKRMKAIINEADDSNVRYAATNRSTTDAKLSFEDFPKSFTLDELEEKDAHAASNKPKMKLIPREYTVDENENELC